MNVISRKKLKAFFESKPVYAQPADAFIEWFKIVRKAHWMSFANAKATFGQTDVAKGDAGKTATIFDIDDNKYRIVAAIDYPRQTVLIKFVGTHKAYDKNLWKREF